MLRMTEVVKNLLIINVIVFFSVRYLIPVPGIERFFVLVTPGINYMDGNTLYTFEPVQIITHMFMHADEKHLFFNMLGLYFLGPWVESSLGHKRFLILYLASGFVASIAQVIATQGIIVGASGAVYGVLAAFATMFPNVELMLLFPPIPIKAKYMALGLILIGLFSGVTGAQAGIGHFAHIGGAVLGFLLVRFWHMANLR
ncbi:MAG: rhomboid family intramembrane serine protease [Saprospiraceae bacterium]|jgi:membrane associated rhomboid family serine protease|nr:rhomboid family intramembrane serine protease [Saprospiraceae bacterium]MBP6237391.1 rhomboid family intramembrane serine protease [Saprospiraceae bacterium]MBP6567210.1 rhomboid family intramembrane serine protease [Saprospiraceae bacterium]